MKHFVKSALLVATTLPWLSGCMSVTASGSEACRIYGERRADLPPDGELIAAPATVTGWIGETDAAMTGVCR